MVLPYRESLTLLALIGNDRVRAGYLDPFGTPITALIDDDAEMTEEWFLALDRMIGTGSVRLSDVSGRYELTPRGRDLLARDFPTWEGVHIQVLR